MTQQGRDLARFMSSPEGNSAKLNFSLRDLLTTLPPAEARPEEIQMFARDLGPLIEQWCPRASTEALASAVYATTAERIA